MKGCFEAVGGFLRLVIAVAANLSGAGFLRMDGMPYARSDFAGVQLYGSLIELGFQLAEETVAFRI